MNACKGVKVWFSLFSASVIDDVS